jgi:hypothetical protein
MYNRIAFWYGATILPIGITLTIITGLCVNSEKILWSSKNNIVMLSFNLAIADCSVLIMNLLLVQLLPSLQLNFTLVSNFTCIFGTFWLKMIVMWASWLQVNVAFNRFLTSYFPNRFHSFKTDKKIIQNVMSFIIIFLVLVNSVNFCLYVYETSDGEMTCGVQNRQAAIAVDMLLAVFRLWVPLPLIFTFHFLNAVYVFRTRNQVGNLLSVGGEEEQAEARHQRQVTFDVICLQGVFVFLNTPLAIFLIFSTVYSYGYNQPLTDELLIFEAVAICMANFFPITPFMMHMVVGTDFKVELAKLFFLKSKDEN